MKNITLVDKHIALGGKMVPFAGFNMPVQYEGVTVEHETVRNAVGVRMGGMGVAIGSLVGKEVSELLGWG